MTTKLEYFWPEVFTTGVLTKTDDDDRSRAAACADALTGWGNCCAGAAIPEKFGEGMAAIGRYLSILPIPEECHKYADKILKTLGEDKP